MSHGGPRPGAGRPRTWATKPIARTLRMSEEAWATLDALTIVLGSSTSQAAAAAICMAAESIGLRRKPVAEPVLVDGGWEELRGGEGYSKRLGHAHLLVNRLTKPKKETWSWEVNWPDPDDLQSGRASTREDAMLAAVVSHDRRVAELTKEEA